MVCAPAACRQARCAWLHCGDTTSSLRRYATRFWRLSTWGCAKELALQRCATCLCCIVAQLDIAVLRLATASLLLQCGFACLHTELALTLAPISRAKVLVGAAIARAAQSLPSQKVQSSSCSAADHLSSPVYARPWRGCNRQSCSKGVHAAKPEPHAAAAQVAELQAHERVPAGARQVAEGVEQQEAELPDAEVDAPEPEADAAAVEAAVSEAAPEPADEQYSVRPAGFLRGSCGVPVGFLRRRPELRCAPLCPWVLSLVNMCTCAASGMRLA